VAAALAVVRSQGASDPAVLVSGPPAGELCNREADSAPASEGRIKQKRELRDEALSKRQGRKGDVKRMRDSYKLRPKTILFLQDMLCLVGCFRP
jgi:hypothetical protein